jgi:CubicO group peptidase (beta-lactamase class C family)
MGVLNWALRYSVDTDHHEVGTQVAHFFSARAIYRPSVGCLGVHGSIPDDTGGLSDTPAPNRSEALLPDIAGPAPVDPTDPRLRAALDGAFAETDRPPYRRTKAVVIVHNGRVIAERYARGYGVDTPLHGHSMTKSVVNALIGVLVRRSAVTVAQTHLTPAWQSRDDARSSITIDQLLRMVSGLPWDEYAGGWDPATRMWYLERDMTAFAQQTRLEAPPGTRWNYSNRGFMVLSRLIRDAVGGHAEEVVRFARHELFEPLGMRNATLELDATGTPIGSSQLYAPARDWARFGMLYLLDGVVAGRRILPKGWVDYTRAQTLDTGYAAGFWINTVSTKAPMVGRWGMPGAPRDAFFARGYLGQFIVVVPSEQLVVVRLGVARTPGGDIATVGRLVGEVVEAIRNSKRASG